MARNLKPYRTIDGKRFYRKASYRSKVSANQKKERLTRAGYLVRIIEGKNLRGKGVMHRVYARHKRS